MIKSLLQFFIVLISLVSLSGQEQQAPLGYPIELNDIYIAGPEVEPIPRRDHSSSVVVRILSIQEAKDGFRYDMSVYGLDPGTYDLVDYLQTKPAGEKLAGVKPIEITITNRHPLETLPKPGELELTAPGKLGGYRTLMIVLVALWAIGLFVLIFYRKRNSEVNEVKEHQPSVHENLHQLVTAASKGELDEAEQANLERLIIGHWKREIPELDEMAPAKALIKLRSHKKASPLILKLEEWLHAPNPQVELSELKPLLEPFRNP